VIERQPDGKMRVTSGSWDGEKIIFRDQVLEVRHAVPDARLKMRVTSGSWDGEKIIFRDQVLEVRHAVPDARLHVARKTKADSLVKR
jgi:glutamate mutase epsilon subunit